MKRIFSVLIDSVILALFAGFIHAAFIVGDPYENRVLGKADFVAILCVMAIIAKWVFVLDQGLLSWILGRSQESAWAKFRRAFFAYPRKHRSDLLLMLGSIAFTLVAVEIFLRVFIGLLPMELGNILGTPYRTGSCGIYTWDADRNMVRFKPDHTQNAFMYGYRWHHQGDYRGYRNPENWDAADIVLLGGSMVYGHGVEEEATIRAHLANELPEKTVANLGQQGAAIDMIYQIFRHDALALDPKHLILFHFHNDLTDLLSRLNEDEMRRLLALRVDDFTTRYFDYEGLKPQRKSLLRPIENMIFKSYLFRSITYAISKLTAGTPSAAAAESPLEETGSDQGEARPPEMIEVTDWRALPFFEESESRQLAMAFHRRMMEKIDLLAQANGVSILHVVIDAEDPAVEWVLARESAKLGWPYLNLKPFLEAREADGVEVFLPGDGHFTDEGARDVAEVLVKEFPELTRP